MSQQQKGNSSLAQKYKAEQFPSDFYAPGVMLDCKFCHCKAIMLTGNSQKGAKATEVQIPVIQIS